MLLLRNSIGLLRCSSIGGNLKDGFFAFSYQFLVQNGSQRTSNQTKKVGAVPSFQAKPTHCHTLGVRLAANGPRPLGPLGVDALQWKIPGSFVINHWAPRTRSSSRFCWANFHSPHEKNLTASADPKLTILGWKWQFVSHVFLSVFSESSLTITNFMACWHLTPDIFFTPTPGSPWTFFPSTPTASCSSRLSCARKNSLKALASIPAAAAAPPPSTKIFSAASTSLRTSSWAGDCAIYRVENGSGSTWFSFISLI